MSKCINHKEDCDNANICPCLFYKSQNELGALEQLEVMNEQEYKDYLDEHVENNYYDKKMLDNHCDYCKISDLAKRFIQIDKEYGHSDWNLTQILANIRMTEYYSLEEIKLMN